MPLPASWTTVPVTWTITGHDGTPAKGVVRFTSAQVVTAAGGTYVPAPITARVTDGVMESVNLPTTDDPDISPTGWTWRVQPLTSPDGPEAFNILVPAAGGPINLATVVPVSSPTPLSAVAIGDQFIAGRVNDATSVARTALDGQYVRDDQLDTGTAANITGPSQTRTALDAAFARPLGNRVVGIGDSHVEGGQQGNPADWRDSSTAGAGNHPLGASMYAWGLHHTKGQFMSVGVWAKGGERTDQIVASWVPPALTSGADVAVLQMGTNDARQGYALTHTITYYTQAIDALRGAGIRPIVVGLPPINDPTTVRDAMDRINNWLRAYCLRERIRFVEIADAMIDTSDRQFAAGMHTDGVHLSATAADLAGQRIAAAIMEVGTPVENVLALSNVDATNLAPNALFLTDADANGIPDGWGTLGSATGITHTIEASVPAGWVGKGAKITAAATADTRRFNKDVFAGSSTFQPGDVMRFAVRAQGSGGVGYYARVQFSGSTTRTLCQVFQSRSTGPTEIAGVQEFVVPAGTTSIAISLAIEAGTGWAMFGQPTLVNLSKLSVPVPEHAPVNGW